MNDLNVTKVTAGELPHLIQLAAKAGRPVMIHSSPGVGKSASVRAAAEAMATEKGLRVAELGEVNDPGSEFGYFDIRLTNMGPEEFGLPVADHDTGIQRRLPVDWLPSTDRKDLPEHGVIAFEELASVGPAMQAAVYQIMLDRRLGDKRIKPGWFLIATGNLMTDGGVVHKMATPLANRMIHLYVRSDVDSWVEWAVKNDVAPVVLAFIRFRPDLLNTFEKHLKNRGGSHAFSTERSWEIVSDLIKQDPETPFPLIAGTVGTGPATEFASFREIWQQMVSVDQILSDPEGAPVPEDSATILAVCTALASRATADNFEAVLTYAKRLRPEYTAVVVKDAYRRNPAEIASSPAFVRWSSEFAEYLV